MIRIRIKVLVIPHPGMRDRKMAFDRMPEKLTPRDEAIRNNFSVLHVSVLFRPEKIPAAGRFLGHY